jgi:hypothetical protein
VTASEVGAVLGCAPRHKDEHLEPREKVFLLKTNQIPPDPDNEFMKHGR